MTPWLKPAQRLGSLPPYVFARLDELKVKARQQGLDLIDLGMGNPDGATPAPVLESASKAIYDQRHHGYPPFEGTASFAKPLRIGITVAIGCNSIPKGKPCRLLAPKRV
jgi:LL-diaminopimelate aminotransferase